MCINHGSISSSSGIINYFLSRLINNENYHDAGKWPVVIHSSLILDKKYSLEWIVIVILYIVKIPVVLLNWRPGYYKYDLLHIPVCHQDWHIKHESSLSVCQEKLLSFVYISLKVRLLWIFRCSFIFAGESLPRK
jgi:hypothetical protein